jgi:metal-dependent amidase/aminoacylase/carboxypeptidase family protein
MPRSTDTWLAKLLALIDGELEQAVQLRHRLHEQPELAHRELRTASIVAEALPVACATVAGTGRLARIGPAAGRALAIRAELDGLPIHERTNAPFSAAGDAMHACGHDVHMAALVALMRAAHALGDALPAPLLAIFQPSEEAFPSGAEQLARVVEGEPSHGAYPHHGRDPVLAIAQIVVALHALAARRIDPLGPTVLNVGVLEGGGAENVIPARARARATIRALRPQDRMALRVLVAQVVEGVASAHGCRGSAELVPGEPPLENDPEIVAHARALFAQGGLEQAPEWRSCGSDDFSFFGEIAPVAMAFVGLDGAPGFTARPLHHPELLPPDEAVAAVARTQAVLYAGAAASLDRG